MKLLKQIQDDTSVSYKPFSTQEELGELIQNDLAILLTERFKMVQAGVLSPPVSTEDRARNLPQDTPNIRFSAGSPGAEIQGE